MNWATFILVVAAVLLAGCSEPNNSPPAAQSIPPYAPSTFRIDVTRLIGDHRYQEAAAYLHSADAERQAVHDRSGFIAVAEDAIVLPGAPADAQFDAKRDWELPGTSDAVIDVAWQAAATKFAEAYNAIAIERPNN
ncbi:hypothetical protein I41_37690 [Lacipirellula limnantheis]|uniref:Uncharacterized protein n=2 Tax=Lacipirellula limnantheis TaxID=2528024 RepID=A0A517U1T6_9BACT|nr:hypothetical protein I41_37690 [Lacipirellula limnantheis]